MTIRNSLKYSSSKGRIWQNAKCMQLVWKQPMSIGKQTWTERTLTGKERCRGLRAMRRTKDMSSTSSSWSLMEIIPSMSSPPTSNWMDYTAWAPSASMSPFIDTNSSPLNASPSMKKGSSPIGFSRASPTTPHTLPCITTPGPRRTGELQLSSNDTMTCTLKLPPWLQSKGAWLLPLKLPKSSWTKASDACLAPMPTSSTSSSAPSMRDPTSTPSPGGSSPPSLEAHTAVQLDLNQRVMSQGSLPRGQENHQTEGWRWLTPRTGRVV